MSEGQTRPVIYLDHHATTPVDPEVIQAMLPFMTEHFANAGSVTHAAGRYVKQAVDAAIGKIADLLGANEDELLITSGATESNNLALFGACLHPSQNRRRIVSLATEHKAILDPLKRLEKAGFDVVRLPVAGNDSEYAGRFDFEQLAEAVNSQTAVVTIMLANNEIGVIQPLEKVAALCRDQGCLLHSDATQAVGRIDVKVDRLGVDMMSFSAHKFYGPKGVGGLYVRRQPRRVRLQAMIVGGGQQHNLRSGTLNSAGIIGMAQALAKCHQLNAWPRRDLGGEQQRLAALRRRFVESLSHRWSGLTINGPSLQLPGSADALIRLPDNLNCGFYPVEGQSLMLRVPDLAVSSGSACTSAESTVSHVLLGIGLTEEQARSSLRFGFGRFNTLEEIDAATEQLADAAYGLLELL